VASVAVAFDDSYRDLEKFVLPGRKYLGSLLLAARSCGVLDVVVSVESEVAPLAESFEVLVAAVHLVMLVSR
jgi:hypothetical protein